MGRRETLAEIQKATTDTTVAADGLLSPEQSASFTRTIKEKGTFSSQIRMERRKARSGKINKLSSNGRIIREATENADDGYRAEVDFPTVDYATKKIRLPWEVTEEVFHENIEGEALEAEIMDEMTQQYSLDLEDLEVNGDDSSGDPFIGINEGLLALCTANTSGDIHRIDADALTYSGNPAMNKALFFAALKALPNKYRASGGAKFFGSPAMAIAWIEYLSDRTTAGGDAALLGLGQAGPGRTPLGIDFVSVPSFPDDRLVLTPPKNLVRVMTWDIRKRKVTGDTDWELATRDKRGYIFFADHDFVIEEDDAVVDVYGITLP